MRFEYFLSALPTSDFKPFTLRYKFIKKNTEEEGVKKF